MGIGKGNVSHNAVLADLDLEVGSLRQRAVYNRLGTTGGNMSLSNHRGVACGSQLNSFRYDDPVAQDTHTGYGGFYPGVASTENYISGTSIILKANYSGGGTWGADGTSEHRTNFKVTEGGQYRITGSADFKGDGYYNLTYWKVCVVQNRLAYMSGRTDLAFNFDPGVYVNDGYEFVDQTFDLSTELPFATLILYAVRKAGGDPGRPASVATFNNWRVVKT